MHIFRIAILSLIMAVPVLVTAQEDWGEGEVEDAVVVIEKERKITLPYASRRFEKVPPLRSETPAYDLSYDPQTVSYSGLPVSPRMRVLTIREENLSKNYGNYVRAGFGNYLTPYLSASVANGRQAEYNYGVKANHLSSGRGPVDGNNSADSYNKLRAYGNIFTETVKFGGDMNYQRDGLYFYGYDPSLEVDRDTIRQVLNQFGLSAYIGSADTEADLQYRIDADFDSFSDNYAAKETDFGLALNSTLILDDPLLFGLEAGVDLTRRSDVSFDRQKRNLYRGKGYLEYNLTDELTLMAGANLVVEQDTSTSFRIYPIARASFMLNQNLELYAGIRGDLEKRTLRKFVNENHFLGPDVNLRHQNRQFELNGGLNGKGFELGFSTAVIKDMAFYVNDVADTTRFSIVYDKTSLLNIFASATLSSSDRHSLYLRGDYYGYKTDTLAAAWHLPNYRVSLTGSTNLADKIFFDLDAYLLGGIEARNPSDFSQRTLNTIVDLNATIEYKFSDQFSFYLSGYNLLGQNYQYYLNYPVRGIQVMAGIGYTF